MSWEVIIPFLQSIEHLLRDPEISDILVNGSGRVFIERAGEMIEVPDAQISEKSLQIAVRNIARVLGDEVSPDRPLLDARLPDGSRVAAVLPPCSVSGTVLAIRKFQGQRYSAEELVRRGALPAEVCDRLRVAVEERRNILISGGTGTGKTTLLNALAGFVPADDRVVII